MHCGLTCARPAAGGSGRPLHYAAYVMHMDLQPRTSLLCGTVHMQACKPLGSRGGRKQAVALSGGAGMCVGSSCWPLPAFIYQPPAARAAIMAGRRCVLRAC